MIELQLNMDLHKYLCEMSSFVSRYADQIRPLDIRYWETTADLTTRCVWSELSTQTELLRILSNTCCYISTPPCTAPPHDWCACSPLVLSLFGKHHPARTACIEVSLKSVLIIRGSTLREQIVRYEVDSITCMGIWKCNDGAWLLLPHGIGLIFTFSCVCVRYQIGWT